MESVGIAKKSWAFLPVRYFSRSIGKKLVVAVTGVVLLGFVTGHMVGNLQVFIGQESLNRYAAFLQGLGELLWVIRGFMALMLILHVWFAVQLKLENWAARPKRYECNDTVQATLSSRTMIWTGILIGAFVTYHLLHFTFVSTDPRLAELRHGHDVYSMVILGFQQPLISIFYIIMMFALAYHLSHAVQSMFQTLGLNNEHYDGGLRRVALAWATILFVGYVAIPVAAMSGILKLPAGVR
jgi:succinate dehydrogenase cytochrome b subunit